MRQSKIACNATNSAAIDNEGNLYVWGSGKHGLLGQGHTEFGYAKPIKLEIQKSKDEGPNDAFTSQDKQAKFNIRDIAMGQFHMAAVAIDGEISQQFEPLNYAKDIFEHLTEYLERLGKDLKPEFYFKETEKRATRLRIESALEHLFKDYKQMWPYIPQDKFQELIFNKAQMSFSKKVGTNTDRLYQDLASPDDDQLINLKELRDQLIGMRTNNGLLFVWGLNDERLGAETNHSRGKTIEYSRPKTIKFKEGVIINKVVCGLSYTLALDSTGKVYSWGFGQSGALGLGAQRTYESSPKQISFPTHNSVQESDGVVIKAIASGANHCMAMNAFGVVYSWGNGQGGRLGHGDQIGKNKPEIIRALLDETIVYIECGDAHSGVINTNGGVSVWGIGLSGRLGLAHDRNVTIPTKISETLDHRVEQIFFGMSSSFALMKNGTYTCWGSSQHGKLGLEIALGRIYLSPKRLTTFGQEVITQIAAGPFHTLALSEEGKLYAFGNAMDGRLGISLTQSMLADLPASEQNIQIPTLVEDAPTFFMMNKVHQFHQNYKNFEGYTHRWTLIDLYKHIPEKSLITVQAVCSTVNSYFLLNSGEVYAVGQNTKFQCTDEQTGDERANYLDDLENRLNSDNEDDDASGNEQDLIPKGVLDQLKTLAKQKDVAVPKKISIIIMKTMQTVAHLAAGGQHVLATTDSGKIFSWGNNEYGQLGVGKAFPRIEKPTMVRALELQKCKMTAAGTNHSLFLTIQGEVYAAGFNEFGQLGFASSNFEADTNIMNVEKKKKLIQGHYIMMKKKTTATKITQLENVWFIAAGAAHSLAIKSMGDSRHPLGLFSWGWGAYGQLGHSSIKNEVNLNRPKHVKFRDQNIKKLAYVSAGTKHTLVLDTDGKLWYFGEKESVGIQCKQDRMQFEPIRLLQYGMTDAIIQKYSIVAAGDNINIAVESSNKQVHQFGRLITKNVAKYEDGWNTSFLDGGSAGSAIAENNNNLAKNHQTYFEKLNLTGRYVCAGLHHCVMISDSYYPYTWGFNGDYRCAQPIADEIIKVPRIVPEFTSIFKAQQKEIQNQTQYRRIKQLQQHGELSKQGNYEKLGVFNKMAIQNIRYPIQAVLKTKAQDQQSQYEMVLQDVQLRNDFNFLTAEFHTLLKDSEEQLMRITTLAQDVLITRVFKFPTPIDQIQEVESIIPKYILRNKQIFEAILTYLQAHPCYLINWILKSDLVEKPADLRLVIQAVFGSKEMLDNSRVINTLLIITKAVMSSELKFNNMKDMTSLYRSDSPFKAIFNLIFENQSSNKRFIKIIIRKIIKLINDLSEQEDFKQVFKKTSDMRPEVYEQIMVQTLLEINKNLEMVTGNKFRVDQSKLECLSPEILTILWYMRKELIDKATKVNSLESMLEDQQINRGALTEKMKQAEMNKQKDLDLINPYLLGLLFDGLITRLSAITFQDLQLEYWDYEEMPDGPKANILEIVNKKNVLSNLSAYFKSYMSRTTVVDMPTKTLRVFITTGVLAADSPIQFEIAKEARGLNFRETLIRSLFEQSFKPLDLNFMLIHQLFETSCKLKDPTVTVAVGDLIFVYNQLVKLGKRIAVADEDKDPIGILINALGNEPIAIQLPVESLRQRLNLVISCRFLINHSRIVRCNGCAAPVTEVMIDSQRFDEAYSGGSGFWICQEQHNGQQCRHENICGHYQCSKCLSPFPKENIPEDLVFKTFEGDSPGEAVTLFRSLLIQLPFIEEKTDIMALLQKAIANDNSSEEQDKYKILQFKKFLDQRIYKHTAKVQISDFGTKVDEKDFQKIAEKITIDKYCDELVKSVTLFQEATEKHMGLIRDYQNSLSSIKKMRNLIVQLESHRTQELGTIIQNIFTGLSSEFLREKLVQYKTAQAQAKSEGKDPTKMVNLAIEKIWAGRLDSYDESQTDQVAQENKKSKGRLVKQQDLMEQFFVEQNDLEARSTSDKRTAVGPRRNGHQSNRRIMGTFRYTYLKTCGAIQQVLSGEYDKEVLKETQYIFTDNRKNGFFCEMLYKQPVQFTLTCSKIKNEVMLEGFEITREVITEMRRNFANQGNITLGKTDFRIFNLLQILNRVVAQNMRPMKILQDTVLNPIDRDVAKNAQKAADDPKDIERQEKEWAEIAGEESDENQELKRSKTNRGRKKKQNASKTKKLKDNTK